MSAEPTLLRRDAGAARLQISRDLDFLQEVISSEHFASKAPDSELRSAVGVLREQVADQEIRLAMVAEANAGKSTFINALLESELLPMGISVGLTAVPTYIHFATEARAMVTYRDGREIPVSVEALSALVREGEEAKRLERADVWCPSEWLRGGLTLVDTPGANVSIDRHLDATRDVIGVCNACVFLIDSSRPGTKSTLRFLKEVASQVHKFFFVLSRADILEESEMEEAVEYLQEVLADECGISNPRIYAISARQALTGNKTNYSTAFDALRDEMRQVLQRDYETILASQVIDVGEKVMALTLREAENRIGLYEQELARLYETHFPPLSEFTDQLTPDVNRRISNQFSSLQEKLLEEARVLKPMVRNMILSSKSKKSLREVLPQLIEGKVQIAQETFYTDLQSSAAHIYHTTISEVDEAFKERLNSIHDVETRLLLRSWLPYTLAVIAGVIYTVAKWGSALSETDVLWMSLIASCAFIIGLLTQSLRTVFKYKVPTLVEAQLTWDKQALVEYKSKHSSRTSNITQDMNFRLNVARVSMTQGPQAGLACLGLGLALDVVGAGVSALWDHFTGPTAEQLQKDLLDRVEPGICKIEQAMEQAATVGIDQYQAACVEFVRKKCQANETKYESVVRALVTRSRKSVAQAEARSVSLKSIVSELEGRLALLSKLRDELRLSLRA